MTNVKLYGSLTGSRSWWVAWMCNELGVDFDNEGSEGFLGKVWKTPEYLAINPSGLVPAIRDGEFVLFESMAINLYLARKYDSRLMGVDTLENDALATQWSFWAITRLDVPFLVVIASNLNLPPGGEMELYFLKHAPMWTPAEVARSRSVLDGPLDVLDQRLALNPYLLGAEFSAADLNVAMVMSRNQLAKIDLSGRPHLVNWLQRCWSRPACPRRDALVKALEEFGSV